MIHLKNASTESPDGHSRKFFLSRHGQSEYNRLGKIGGDSGLSDLGKAYAKVLSDYAHRVVAESGSVPARLWTSTLRRTIETSDFIDQNQSIHYPGYMAGGALGTNRSSETPGLQVATARTPSKNLLEPQVLEGGSVSPKLRQFLSRHRSSRWVRC